MCIIILFILGIFQISIHYSHRLTNALLYKFFDQDNKISEHCKHHILDIIIRAKKFIKLILINKVTKFQDIFSFKTS